MSDDGDYIFSYEVERQPADSIFKIYGQPIPIYLHPSLSRGGSRAIAMKIEAAGGDPYATESEARVIICRYGTPIFSELEFAYDHDRYKWVEPPSWVDICIDLGRYEHYLPGKADKTQRHNTRTSFSLEDDEHLVQFLARRIPYKDSGGRLGNGVYKDLCNERRASLYPWAKHHPWQSWRDRYSKNQGVFDVRIDHAVNRDPDPPTPGGNGQYVIPRKARKPQPLKYNVRMEEESDDAEFEEEGQDEQLRQQEQARQEELRRKERREEEEDADDDNGAIDTTAKKRSRQEPDLQDGRIERSRQFTPPPRKIPRIPIVPSDSAEDDAFIGIGQDKGKGKGRQLPSDLELERPENMDLNGDLFSAIYNDNEPGPSQWYKEVDATTRSSEDNVANGQEPEAIASPPLNSSGVRAAATPAAVPKMLPDTQMTLVASTQSHPERNTAPPETRPTIVPPSTPRHNSERHQRAARRGASRKPGPQRSVAHNTRARGPSGSSFFQLGNSQPTPDKKRPRGRPKKPPLPYVNLQRTTASAVNASLGEEVQVEEILQVSEEKNSQEHSDGDREGDSSSEGVSSEDDEAVRILRNANKRLISEGTRSRSRPRSSAAAPNLRQVPFIDITREADRPSRKLAVLRPSSRRPDPDPDPDATPRAQPLNARKAAKKTAAQGPAPNSHDSDSDLQSGSTVSSFPVEATNAREYVNAQSLFTPAPGTKAEEHIRSERRKTRQGSGRAL